MNRRLTVLRETLDDAPATADGRTITMRVATYDRIYNIGAGRRERIRRGAFKDALSRPRAALRWRHMGERPGDDDPLANYYGDMVALREEGDALIADFRVYEEPAGDKLLRLVQSGTVTGVSLAAVIREERPVSTPSGRVVDILRFGPLDGVSITPANAYDDARVMAVRETPPQIAAERAFWANLRNVR